MLEVSCNGQPPGHAGKARARLTARNQGAGGAGVGTAAGSAETRERRAPARAQIARVSVAACDRPIPNREVPGERCPPSLPDR